MKLDDSKITSYKELVPLLQEIKDKLESVNRGFVFTTLPKNDDKGKSRRPLVCISNKSENPTESLAEFWAGIMQVVEALNNTVPEDERDLWKDTWITFIEATNDLCFPSIHMEKIN